MLKKTDLTENHLFVGVFLIEPKILRKIGKHVLQVRCRCFHFVFEGLFSDSPFLRLSRQKTDAYVKKKMGKKLVSDYLNAVLRAALNKFRNEYSLSRREESSKHKLSDCLLACVSALYWLVQKVIRMEED
jgi:hypothetical protein